MPEEYREVIMRGTEIWFDVDHCPRCGHSHGAMLVHDLPNPRTELTHWAPCPVTLAPILFEMIEGEQEAT